MILKCFVYSLYIFVEPSTFFSTATRWKCASLKNSAFHQEYWCRNKIQGPVKSQYSTLVSERSRNDADLRLKLLFCLNLTQKTRSSNKTSSWSSIRNICACTAVFNSVHKRTAFVIPPYCCLKMHQDTIIAGPETPTCIQTRKNKKANSAHCCLWQDEIY